jgi:hypothetical protein
MASCHDLFREYFEKIKLTSSKKSSLRKSRDGTRSQIRTYFKETRKEDVPKFKGQGSYYMVTTINPLDGEYDIDDGVYLQNLPIDKKQWPSAETVHGWIKEAVEDQTNTPPEDKATCVRVIYAGEYHVDLPIYGIYDGNAYLAVKGDKQWNSSEPIKLGDWFLGRVKKNGEQLRDIVLYFKAWADKKPNKMPSGLILTVLAEGNYCADERDDVAFSKTIEDIYAEIKDSFSVKNPIDESEELTDRLSSTQKSNFRAALQTLVKSGKEALDEKDEKKASEIWQKEFGDRFPTYQNGKEENKGGVAEVNVFRPRATSPWSRT